MAETYVAVQRRGKATWQVGAVTDNLQFLGGDVDKDGISTISLQESTEVAHTKDSNGGNALSVFFNPGMTGNITLVYAPGAKPHPGDVVVYTDPDDESAQKALQITAVGIESSNSMTANTMPVTVEWYAAWQDDAKLIAAATTTDLTV